MSAYNFPFKSEVIAYLTVDNDNLRDEVYFQTALEVCRASGVSKVRFRLRGVPYIVVPNGAVYRTVELRKSENVLIAKLPNEESSPDSPSPLQKAAEVYKILRPPRFTPRIFPRRSESESAQKERPQ